VTTAKRLEAKAKRRSEMTLDARLDEIEREIDRLKANVSLLETFKVRVDSMLKLLSRRGAS
jgi:hypothetical protein